MTTGALERLIRRAGARRSDLAEHCDLCAVPVADDHRHLLDVEQGRVLCTCRACTLLFVQDAASEGHYRLVPERRLRLPRVPTKGLGVPVGLAYFTRDDAGSVLAHYPSPAGATEWEVDGSAWEHAVGVVPELADLKPHVEALLVNNARGHDDHWIVPLDDCFRLVAVVRREWRGLSGGTTVWPAIEHFFSGLTEQT